jgi:hypothetical protein
MSHRKCCEPKSRKNTIPTGAETVITVGGDFEAHNSDNTVIVTGKASTETVATVTLPDDPRFQGQTIKIVASGAPVNVDPGDEGNTVAGGRTYVAQGSTATFTFTEGSDEDDDEDHEHDDCCDCTPGQWIGDCCAILPPQQG